MRRIRKRLGEMLVEAELLSEEQLNGFLGEARQAGLKIGDFLIDRGIVSETQIIDLLSDQLQIEKFNPDKFEITPALAALIPNELATKYQLVPLGKDDFIMYISTIDPMNITALDQIEKLTNAEVEPTICTKSQLSLLMNGIYGIRSAVSDVLQDMEQEVDIQATEGEKEMALGDLHDMAGAAPVIRLVNSILRQAVMEKASDVHISPEREKAQVRLRIDGKLHEIPPPPRGTLAGIVSRIKILSNMDITNTRIPLDGRFNVMVDKKEVNIRVSTLPTIYGENLVMRLLFVSAGSLPLKDLGLLPEDLEKLRGLAAAPYGMILSAGPTGSGKSSTLYAILNDIIDPEINIITLEDPVEFRMAGVRQVQLNVKAGMTFASGLRSILRQDPDVIMVGEIRDGETAMIATQAALTGHLVLSTLHTNDSASSVSRLQNMGVEPFLISASLLGVCAQRLIRRICTYCGEPHQPSQAVLDYWQIPASELAGATFKRGKGCSYCLQSGFKGRAGIYEILKIDDTARELILKGANSTTIANTLRDTGKLRLLRDVALHKVKAGITTFEEAAKTVLI